MNLRRRSGRLILAVSATFGAMGAKDVRRRTNGGLKIADNRRRVVLYATKAERREDDGQQSRKSEASTGRALERIRHHARQR